MSEMKFIFGYGETNNRNHAKKVSRSAKFVKQCGLCHWCGLLMQTNPMTLSGRHNDLYATFEHIVRASHLRAQGQTSPPNNQVLAHAVCNRRRDELDDVAFAGHIARMQRLWPALKPGDDMPLSDAAEDKSQ